MNKHCMREERFFSSDSILYTAAHTHALYLDSTKQISHFEKEFPWNSRTIPSRSTAM